MSSTTASEREPQSTSQSQWPPSVSPIKSTHPHSPLATFPAHVHGFPEGSGLGGEPDRRRRDSSVSSLGRIRSKDSLGKSERQRTFSSATTAASLSGVSTLVERPRASSIGRQPPPFIRLDHHPHSQLHLHTKNVPASPRDSGWRTWLDMSRVEWDLLVLSTVCKVLLWPAYKSTDFEVHRNWLAITHSLPLSKWYYDTTSEWTLDYPPFFAYFEYVMSFPAAWIDPQIVDLNNLKYDAWTVVAYQRTTVIVTELVMALALLRFISGSTDPSTQRIISASLFFHPGFLIVDHIHFQYNGFMFGILLWSILMARNGKKLASGILFAVLLNFKHIYMYLAPAYFIYLLRTFCLSPQGSIQVPQFLSLANAVLAVFAISLGPFTLMGQLPQLLSRLFPFTRGLNHAYWAPNVWALVTAADRVLLKFAKSLAADAPGVASTSRGLVGDTVFAVLPNIKPIHTFVVTILFQTIFLVKLWRMPTYKSFVTALTLCGYTSYMFGWHVHEKAILLVLVPLSLLAADNNEYFRTFVLASVAGIFSLFPLLFTPAETLVKIVYSAVWGIFVFNPISRRVYRFPRTIPLVVLDWLERIYLAGFIPLQLFITAFPLLSSHSSLSPQPEIETACVYHPPMLKPACTMSAGAVTGTVIEGKTTTDLGGGAVLEFLPLMLTSVYCAVGLCWAFLRLSVLYLRQK